METTYKLKIVESTLGKPGTKQSSRYSAAQLKHWDNGTELEIRAHEPVGVHTKITLVKPDPYTNRIVHYLYNPHIEIEGNDPNNDPSSEAAKRDDALVNTANHQKVREERDRGRRVYLVGLGYRYENDPIDGTQNMYWYEATKNFTRLPEHSYQSYNIVDTAKALQWARDTLLDGESMIFTSWLRPAKVNAAIGGSSISTHISGSGSDWYCPNLTEGEVYRRLDPHWRFGLAIRPGAFCHTDLGRDAYDRLMSYIRRWKY